MRLLDIANVQPSSESAALNFWHHLKWAVAAVFAWAGTHLDGQGPAALLEVYGIFILLDFVTGVLASILMRKVSSAIALRGIVKKCMGICVIVFGHAVDLFLAQYKAGPPGGFQTALTWAMIGYEGISISENAVAAGFVLPKSMTDLFQRLTSPPVIPGTKVVVDTVKEVEHATVTTQTLTPVPPVKGEKGAPATPGSPGGTT